MEEILTAYYENNAFKLRRIVDKILLNFGGLTYMDRDDFYSLANEVFADVIRRYHSTRPFDGFLYSCLTNRIKSEITKRNREKRKADRMTVSMETPVGDDEEHTLGEILISNFDLEEQVLGQDDEKGYSTKMLLYLSRLSVHQRRVLKLTTDGYGPCEIRKMMGITKKQYLDCGRAIRSYRNISVLF